MSRSGASRKEGNVAYTECMLRADPSTRSMDIRTSQRAGQIEGEN